MILEDFIVKNISSASQDTPCALIIFFKLMIDTRLKVETSLGQKYSSFGMENECLRRLNWNLIEIVKPLPLWIFSNAHVCCMERHELEGRFWQATYDHKSLFGYLKVGLLKVFTSPWKCVKMYQTRWGNELKNLVIKWCNHLHRSIQSVCQA